MTVTTRFDCREVKLTANSQTDRLVTCADSQLIKNDWISQRTISDEEEKNEIRGSGDEEEEKM